MKGTLSLIWHDLMLSPSFDNLEHRCVICGRPATDLHHMVPRSAGELFDEYSRKLKKPTIRLCGSGNMCGCHGLAHQKKLHFRYVFEEYTNTRTNLSYGARHLEYLLCDEPTSRLDALEMDGWRLVRTGELLSAKKAKNNRKRG